MSILSIVDHLKTANQQAEQLAQAKQLREAVTTLETALDIWKKKPSWERLVDKLLIGNLVDKLEQQLTKWRTQIDQADQFIAQAQKILKNDTSDPLETQFLTSAIRFYNLYNQIITDDWISEVIAECQQILSQRQQFQALVNQAKTQAEKLLFKQAITIYRQAEKLYPTQEIKQVIANIQIKVIQEENYHSTLQKVQQAEYEGRLQAAIALLDSALVNFPRHDGFKLLENLKSKVQGRELFRQALTAEKAGDFLAATSFYKNAQPLLQNPSDCQIRLGLVAIKMQDWQTALSYLQDLSGEQAIYLRGYIFAQQSNLKSAEQEWQKISDPAVTEQRKLLQQIFQRQYLLSLQKIEELVKTQNLAAAKTASQEFIHKFNANSLVSRNLQTHIQPSLEAALWKDANQNSNWENIADYSQQLWLNHPHSTTLHNWTVATYYHAQTNPEKLCDLIIALSTSLANLNTDSSLQNIPWLGNKTVDIHAVSLKLKRHLEAAIDHVKNADNLEDQKKLKLYLNLRDIYRWQQISLRFMGEPANSGIQVNGIFITPGCWYRFREQWHNIIVEKIHSHQQILRSLYTPWGLAVAACLEGDSQRAIQLKPSQKPTREIEQFAHNFLAYHEGCYYLQQQKWFTAIIPLQSIKTAITNHQDWQQEINRLCKLQRQVISEFREHLQFAEFWYDILSSSKSAKNYFAEYKSEQIRQQLLHEQISLSQALAKLQELHKIDHTNSLIIDMIENVQISQEIKEINQLFQTRQYAEMLSKAKLSQRDKVRYIVAGFFIEMLTKGIKEGRLHNSQLMLQLGNWAYEICPDEPEFQQVYQSLKLS